MHAHDQHHGHHGGGHRLHGHHYSFRVQVILNAADRFNTDYFRISYRTSWENFFDRVRMALCPDFVPEATDCMRDQTGAHVFDIDVLTHGEVLYFCPRGQPLRNETGLQPGLQQPTPHNFLQGPGFTPGFDLRASAGPGQFNITPGLDSQISLSFPDPDGSQPVVIPESSPLLNSGTVSIYFPSPVPPDEEPPYVPEQHEDRKAQEASGHVGHTGGNAGANVGGNTGLAENSEQSKPEGELEEKADTEEKGKEKEPEKLDSKA